MFTLHNITPTGDLAGYFAESRPCPSCHYTHTVFVTPEQMFAYNQGAYVQEVLAGYSTDVRERFISGYCGECWNDLFGYEDEDEEYIDYYAEASLFGWEN